MRGLHEQYVALVEKRDNPSLTWEDFADIRYEATGIKESAETLRKGAKLFYEYLNAGWINPPTNTNTSALTSGWQTVESTLVDQDSSDVNSAASLRELQAQQLLIEKEKIKVRDERNELRRIIREEARKESFVEQVIQSLNESNFPPLAFDINRHEITFSGDNDLIVTMTDLHVGIEIDSYFNRFNEDVFRERLVEYIDKIVEVQTRHQSENCHVILSELISGIIHSTLRIENNQNVIQQFLTAVSYIAQVLSELTYYFKDVHVYIAPGNHSRVTANKNDALKCENFDHLVLPFLEAKLQNHHNIQYHYNDMEESIAIFEVRGNVVMATHGDKDTPNNVVQHFTNMFHSVPDICFLSHRHYNAMSSVGLTRIIQSGCISGIDNYCCDMRLRNRPEQIIAVISERGADCLYNVTFKK